MSDLTDWAFLARAEQDIAVDDGCEQTYCPIE
jgi:hypothetical protein